MKNVLRNITKKSNINVANSVTVDIANISDLKLLQGIILNCLVHLVTDLLVFHFMYRNCEFDPLYLIAFLKKVYITNKIVHSVSLNPLWNFQSQSFVRLH